LLALAVLIGLAAIEFSTLGDFHREATKPPPVPEITTPGPDVPVQLAILVVAAFSAQAVLLRRRAR